MPKSSFYSFYPCSINVEVVVNPYTIIVCLLASFSLSSISSSALSSRTGQQYITILEILLYAYLGPTYTLLESLRALDQPIFFPLVINSN